MATANMLTTFNSYNQEDNCMSHGHGMSYGSQNCVFLPSDGSFHQTCGPVSGGGLIPSAILAAPGGSPVRQLKRLHPGATNTATEMMRCKRRIEFASQLGYGIANANGGRHISSVARRNERERNRVRLVNLGFATLRQHIPCAGRAKKMSKVDTLKGAVDYISHLRRVLEEHDAVESAFSDGSLPAMSPAASSSSADDGARSPDYTSDSSAGLDGVVATEPSLLDDEDELVDFASWFN